MSTVTRPLLRLLAAGLMAAAANAPAAVTDPGDDTARFFLLPGETSTAALEAIAGQVHLRKARAGDAFTRWSAAPMQRLPLDAEHRWLSIDLAATRGGSSELSPTLVLFTGNQRAGKVDLPRARGPELIQVDVRAAADEHAPEADGWWLFLRHSGDADGVILINRILVTADQPDLAVEQAAAVDPTDAPPAPGLLALDPWGGMRLTTRWGEPDWAALTNGTTSRTLSVPERTRGLELRLEAADEPVRIPALRALTLRCDLRAGSGLRVYPVIEDAAGEHLSFAPRTLAPGVNELRWSHLDQAVAVSSYRGDQNRRLDGDHARIHRLVIERDDADAPGVELVIDELRAHAAAEPAAVLSADVDTGTPYHVLRTDRDDPLAFVVTNPSEQAVTVRAELRVEGVDRSVREVARDLAVPAGGSARWEDFVAVDRFGQWFVDYALTGPDGARREGLLSFARMEPVGPTAFRREGFHFGVNGGVPERGSDEAMRAGAEAIAIAGIKVVRSSLVWEALQYGGPGKWDDAKIADFGRMLDHSRDHGLEHQILLGYGVPWNAPEADRKSGDRSAWQFSPPNHGDMDAWLTYVDLMLSTYGDRVRYWEVWNEPDLWNFWQGSSADYIAFLEQTYHAIKAQDATHQVLTGGFATIGGHGGHREKDFQRTVCLEAEPWYDILAHHQHGHPNHFYDYIDGPLQAIRDDLQDPDKPLWFNETATNTRDDRYRAQAAGLVQKLTFGWSRGASGYVWYQMITGDLSTRSRRAWGLMASGWYPKPNYVAYNALTRMTGDKRHDRVFDAGDQRHVLGFAPLAAEGDDYSVVLWHEEDYQPQEPAVFALAEGAAADQVDLMGNASALPVHRGMALIESGMYPRYLHVTGSGARPVMRAPLIDLPERLPAAAPGRDFPLGVVVSNPFDHELALDLAWHDVPGAADGAIATTLTLAPRTSQEHTFRLPIAPDFDLPFGDFHHLRLHYAASDVGWSGILAVPLEPATTVAAEAAADRPADVVLDEYRYVQNRHENDPRSSHLTWQGPEDLSLRAWFDRADDALRIRVAVTDDHHHPVPGTDWGEGDCLEIQLAAGLDGDKTHLVLWERDGELHHDLRSGLENRGIDFAGTVRAGEGGTRTYIIALPLSALGWDPATLAAGFRVTLAARDRDQGPREGWIQMAPSVHHWTTTGDVPEFPVVMVE